MPIKDVVSQRQCTGVMPDKVLSDDESLRQAVGAGLNGVLDIHGPLAAITQQLSKAWRVLRCADQQHITDARQDQRGQREYAMGLSYTGINCLLTACVTGYRRVPEPPAKIIPLRFIIFRL
jgi:hypothetical protein